MLNATFSKIFKHCVKVKMCPTIVFRGVQFCESCSWYKMLMAPWHNWQLSQSLPIDSIAAQIIIMGAIIDTLEKKQRLKCHHHYCHYGWHESWRRRQLCTLVWLVKISDFRLMRKMTPKAQQFDMYQWSITQKIPELLCQFWLSNTKL